MKYFACLEPNAFDNFNSYNKKNHYTRRTRVKIPFDVKHRFSINAYHCWTNFENCNYKEKYCHKTGDNSNGRTVMAKPILNKTR